MGPCCAPRFCHSGIFPLPFSAISGLWAPAAEGRAAGEPWPVDLRLARADGSADWVVMGFSAVYTVVTCWLMLQVRMLVAGNYY